MTPTPQLTAEQHAALTRRGVSIALDAGAGCGKTFVLTERFLSHLDPGDPAAPPAELEELIAITFTDAAAREMRERIRKACFARLERAGAAEGDYWLTILRSIESARVQTIHSFCGALVRGHAIELGIDPLFQVLDAAAGQVMRSEAIDAALRRRLDARDAVVMRLAKEFDLPGLKRRISGLLDEAATPAFAAWLEASPANAVQSWRDVYQQDYLPLAAQRLGETPAAAELRELLPQATPKSPGFAQVRDEFFARLERMTTGEATSDDLHDLRPLTMIPKVCKQADWPDKDIFVQYKAAAKAFRDVLDKIMPLADEASLLAAAELGRDLLNLTSEVDGAYRAAKQSAGVLDYDDLLHEARRLLTAPEFAEIQRRQQSRVRLLLVDEFQDTDRGQVEIVKALVGPGFAEGRLFFVGDFKQSIYRFRGAEPNVFRELQDETPPEGRLPLATNFRSQPAVIEFINTLFRSVFRGDYQPLQPARPQITDRPAVEFHWTPKAEDASAPAAREAEARAIAARIRKLIDEQTPLVGQRGADGAWTRRPVRPGDIAILFRALSDVAHYEQALRDEQIEYYLVGGHAFYSQQEVYDVTNLLRAIASECDEIALAGVLRSPFFSLHDETLFWLTRLSGSSLSAGFAREQTPRELSPDESAKLAFARKTLAALRERKGRATVAEILADAIRRAAFDAILLSEFLGERKLANLSKLVDQARAFDAYRPGDLDGFVRQLSEFIAREPKEALAAMRADATDDDHPGEVQLMTVHGAKGLEFPVVVVADLDRKSRSDSDPVALNAEMGPLVHPPDREEKMMFGLDLHRQFDKAAKEAEDERLFYVACTRAADYLILSASYSTGTKPVGPWMKTLIDWFDPATGRLLDEQARDSDGQDIPLVHVTAANPNTGGTKSQNNRVDRQKLLEAALAKGQAAAWPASALPIPLRGDAIRRFSVSRLTGQLHHATTRPVAQDVAAALTSPADDIDPRGLGTLVHALLERIDIGSRQPARPDLLKRWSEELAPLQVHRRIDEAAREAEQMVARFMSSTRYQTLQQAQRVEREVEFLLPWPAAGGYLQGYIDCLVQDSAGEWSILDYKTNRVDAAGVPAVAEEYRFQLYVYALAVEQAYGVAPRGLSIYFLRPGVEETFAWDDAARTACHRMVNEAIAGVRAEAVALDRATRCE